MIFPEPMPIKQQKGETGLESYVINIYRREPEARMIVGIVEKVGVPGKQAFQTSDGLLAALRAEFRQDRRREGRLRLKLPLIVEGVSECGKYFREHTSLMDISPHGARFSMKNKPEPGQAVLISIDPDHTALEIAVNIVRKIDRGGDQEMAVTF